MPPYGPVRYRKDFSLLLFTWVTLVLWSLIDSPINIWLSTINFLCCAFQFGWLGGKTLAIYGWACQCDLSCEIFFSFISAFRNFFVSIFVSVNGQNQNFSANGYFRFRWITCIEYLCTYFFLISTVCLMLGLMIGNGMHAVLFVHWSLLLHKELVLPYQVSWREMEIQRKRKRISKFISFRFTFFHFRLVSVFL